jgi:hypothetical protein
VLVDRGEVGWAGGDGCVPGRIPNVGTPRWRFGVFLIGAHGLVWSEGILAKVGCSSLLISLNLESLEEFMCITGIKQPRSSTCRNISISSVSKERGLIDFNVSTILATYLSCLQSAPRGALIRYSSYESPGELILRHILHARPAYISHFRRISFLRTEWQ